MSGEEDDKSGYSGQAGLTDDTSEYNQQEFTSKQVQGRTRTVVAVKVVKVNGGGLAGPATLDVQPVVKQMNGTGKTQSHAVIHGIPAPRLQAAGRAIINDPKAGDVAYITVMDRDISALKENNGKESNPGSFRQHDLADGVYLTQIINNVPTPQYTNYKETGIETVGKEVTITGGPEADKTSHELNKFMKGAVADLAQVKHLIAGLHNSISKFRENAEIALPALAPLNLGTQVTAALNKLPSGLDAMTTDVQGQLTAYAQKQFQQALGKFTNPSLVVSMTSLLSGNLEQLIDQAKSQISGLLEANPVARLVDALQSTINDLPTSGKPADQVTAEVKQLTAQIEELAKSNPVVAQVANLRATLQGYLNSAGEAINFLGVQKRAAEGLVRSVKFSS